MIERYRFFFLCYSLNKRCKCKNVWTEILEIFHLHMNPWIEFCFKVRHIFNVWMEHFYWVIFLFFLSLTWAMVKIIEPSCKEQFWLSIMKYNNLSIFFFALFFPNISFLFSSLFSYILQCAYLSKCFGFFFSFYSTIFFCTFFPCFHFFLLHSFFFPLHLLFFFMADIFKNVFQYRIAIFPK